MLRIKFIVMGSLSEPYWKSACGEYKKRFTGKASVDEVQLKEETLSKNPSAAEIKRALEAEADRIIPEIPKRAIVIPMCVEGKQLSSEELAAKIKDIQISGVSDICFIVGSSFGLSDRVKGLANIKLSMSRLTFPHQLARVMLYETVYRSLSIIAGEKYHK